MQVNSAQDYLTSLKRQIIAKSLSVAPPPQKRRTNTMYTAVRANNARQYVKFVSAPGVNNISNTNLGTTYTSYCCVPANTASTTYLV
jgi:hypothetical protein